MDITDGRKQSALWYQLKDLFCNEHESDDFDEQ